MFLLANVLRFVSMWATFVKPSKIFSYEISFLITHTYSPLSSQNGLHLIPDRPFAFPLVSLLRNLIRLTSI